MCGGYAVVAAIAMFVHDYAPQRLRKCAAEGRRRSQWSPLEQRLVLLRTTTACERRASGASRRRRRGDVCRGCATTGADEGESRTRTVAGTSDGDTSEVDRAVASILQKPATRRRVTSCECAEECLYELLEIGQEIGHDPSEWHLKQKALENLVEVILEDGNAKLAIDVFRVLYDGPRSQLPFKLTSDVSEARSFLLLCLIRSLYVEKALKFLEDSCKVSLPGPDQISFGQVVTCPYCSEEVNKGEREVSLSVVKTFHGAETTACGNCRYQYDLFSGTITAAKSEAPDAQGGDSFLEKVSRIRLWGGRRDGVTHEFAVEAPDGTARAYKFATETDEIPGKVGDRVTIIGATRSKSRLGRGGPGGAGLAPIPPGWKAGEPKSIFNHRLGKTTKVLRAYGPDSGIPLQWVVLGTAVLAGGDASSALVSPDLPALLAAGAMGTTAAGAFATKVALPRLAKLPPSDLAAVEYRQGFLEQYDAIKTKLDALLSSMGEDVQLLSRLWNLHHKIEALGGTSASYDARMRKILTSAETLEDRVASKLQLIEGYSRVSHMIEIEIELDTDIDAAETRVAASGISDELARVSEMEELKDEWTIQVEAKNEIEKLLKSDQIG